MVFTEHVKIREEKFGAVIFETLKEKVYVTNETGKDILAFLKEGNAPNEIIDSLANKYNQDRTFVESDVKDFIESLLKNGLVNNAGSH